MPGLASGSVTGGARWLMTRVGEARWAEEKVAPPLNKRALVQVGHLFR